MMLSSWKVCCAKVSQRWIFAVMGCLAITNAYTMRTCLSLTITEMVITERTHSNFTNLDDTCPTTTESTSTSSRIGGTYEWDEYTQGIILSSFYWGYIITQLPGAVVADMIGAKYTLALGIFSSAIVSFLIPVVVQAYDATGLIVLQILMGFGQGIIFPAVSKLIAQWAPPLERSKISAIVMSGMAIGTVVGNAMSGILIQNSPIGWPLVFYFYGSLGMLYFFAWIVLCYNNSDEHPFITEKEKKYIHKTTNKHSDKEARPRTPWLHILTSVPVWAFLIAQMGFSAGIQVIIADLPKYMSNVLNFSIQANGFVSALPHVLMWLVSSLSSWLADWLIKSEKMSRTNVRKICHTLASVIPAIFFIAATYAGCNRTAVVILFAIGVGVMGPYYITLMINPNDLSSNYASSLMALSNVFGGLADMGAPYVVGLLTPNQTLSEWRLVFWIVFGLLVGTALVFHVWADGEIQYWDDLDSEIDRRNEVESKRQAGENVSTSKRSETRPNLKTGIRL